MKEVFDYNPLFKIIIDRNCFCLPNWKGYFNRLTAPGNYPNLPPLTKSKLHKIHKLIGHLMCPICEVFLEVGLNKDISNVYQDLFNEDWIDNINDFEGNKAPYLTPITVLNHINALNFPLGIIKSYFELAQNVTYKITDISWGEEFERQNPQQREFRFTLTESEWNNLAQYEEDNHTHYSYEPNQSLYELLANKIEEETGIYLEDMKVFELNSKDGTWTRLIGEYE